MVWGKYAIYFQNIDSFLKTKYLEPFTTYGKHFFQQFYILFQYDYSALDVAFEGIAHLYHTCLLDYTSRI